jgi:replication factor A1
LETADFKWRAMLNVSFADYSDFVWGTCFQESAEILLAEKAENLGEMYENNSSAFDMVVKEAVFKNYIVKFRAKMETYNVSQRR